MDKGLPLGYDQAIKLKIYEGQLVWARSQTLLVVNAILLATGGIFLDSQAPNRIALGSLSFLGFLFSVIWGITTIRGFAFNKFWSFSAREMENNSTLQLLTRGGMFRGNKEVEFNFKDANGLKKRYRRPFLGRLPISAEIGMYLVIGLFIFIYVGLFSLSLTNNLGLIKVK